jgi:hypothetical protein
MPEQQNIEYKQSWHVDYPKGGNTHGSIIYIDKDDLERWWV